MTQYLLRRALLIVPTFIGVTLVVFVITRLVPGGPVERILAEMQSSSSTTPSITQLDQEQIDQLNAYYGFDKPILISYWDWFVLLLKGNLGTSSRYGDPVIEMITDRLPISIFYGVTSMLLTYLVCIPLGIIKAIKHRSFIDHASSVLVFIGYALPSYVLGIILLIFFAAHLEWFPMGGFYGDDFEDLNLWQQVWDILTHAVLPMTAYILGSFAVTTFMMKNALMDHLAADFVRTAMAKGMSFRRAVLKHALQNSLIPLATHFGNNISVIIAGSFLIEKIFNIEGFGLLGFDAIIERDYPVVMGILVISALLQLIGNILSDVCVALVDPRVQF